MENRNQTTKIKVGDNTIEIITEQVEKNTFDGVRYELVSWVFYATYGTFHTIPYGHLYYEERNFSDNEIQDYHNTFIKDFTTNPSKYLVD